MNWQGHGEKRRTGRENVVNAMLDGVCHSGSQANREVWLGHSVVGHGVRAKAV